MKSRYPKVITNLPKAKGTSKFSPGKGDRNRVTDKRTWDKNYMAIFRRKT